VIGGQVSWPRNQKDAVPAGLIGLKEVWENYCLEPTTHPANPRIQVSLPPKT
jgi:hypothetical protein